MRTMIGLLVLLLAAPVAAADLYVSPTGNDSVSRASNSATTPWRTIGRAAWGSTNRGAMNASEAARAGDVVHVAGGAYDFQGLVRSRFQSVYHTANAGAAGSYITFACEGVCVLTAPGANSPIIGASERNHIKWFADVNAGNRWVVNNCGNEAGCPASGVTNSAPDTGPVVCHASTGCWVEGVTIDGGPVIDFRDNYNAFRVENCTGCVIRNNTAANFRGNNHNQSIVTLYGARDVTIEHNAGTNAGSGVFFKDTGSSNPQSGNIVRFNRFDRVGEVFAWSVTAEGRNTLYQNVATNAGMCVSVVGGGFNGDVIASNTFSGCSLAGIAHNGAGSGGLLQNNIFARPAVAVYMAGTGYPSRAAMSLDRNVYASAGTFYEGTNGRQTFDAYRAATGQDANSSTADPLLGVDYRLAASSPARTLGRAISGIGGPDGTVIPAGAYITGDEQIGPGGGSAPPPPPPPTPVDCAGTWGAWTRQQGSETACVAGSRTFIESRLFTVTQPPANGGAACPASPESRTSTEPCAMPPVDTCIAAPLVVTSIAWPGSAEGARSGRFTWGVAGLVVTLQSVEFTWNPQRLRVVDSRGCPVTVSR